MKIELKYDFRQVRHLMDGRSHQRTVDAVSGAIRRGLALVERHHKREEMRRGAGTSDPIPDILTSRTGELSRSYRVYYQRGDLIGYYGSEMPRAAKLEEGGIIRPLGKFLAIPTKETRIGVGGSIRAKNWPRPLFYIQSLKGQPMLAEEGPGPNDITVRFILRRLVRLSPRRTLQRTAEAKTNDVERMIADAAEKAVRGA